MSTTLVPPTSQVMEALGLANRCRLARAAVKRGIANGRRSPLEVLQNPPEPIEGMKVRELLLSVPQLGPKKVDKLLKRCRIGQTKTVGDLTERQVWELDEKLSTVNAWCVALGNH